MIQATFSFRFLRPFPMDRFTRCRTAKAAEPSFSLEKPHRPGRSSSSGVLVVVAGHIQTLDGNYRGYKRSS